MKVAGGLLPCPPARGAPHNRKKDAPTAARNGARVVTTAKMAGPTTQDKKGDLHGQLNQHHIDSATSRIVAPQQAHTPQDPRFVDELARIRGELDNLIATR